MAMPALAEPYARVARRLHDVRGAGRPARLRRPVHRGPHRAASGWCTCTRSGRPELDFEVPTVRRVLGGGPAAAADRGRADAARRLPRRPGRPSTGTPRAGASRSSPPTSTGSATTTARAIRRGSSPTSGSAVHARRAYPLHLLANQPATRLHSQLDGGATSLDSKVQGREPIRMHPARCRATRAGRGRRGAGVQRPRRLPGRRRRRRRAAPRRRAAVDRRLVRPRGPGGPRRDVRARQPQRAHRRRRHVVAGQGLHRRARAGGGREVRPARCRRCGRTSRRRSSGDRMAARRSNARSWSEPDPSRTWGDEGPPPRRAPPPEPAGRPPARVAAERASRCRRPEPPLPRLPPPPPRDGGVAGRTGGSRWGAISPTSSRTLAESARTCCGAAVMPALRSNCWVSLRCSGRTTVTTSPALPARAVRPERCR